MLHALISPLVLHGQSGVIILQARYHLQRMYVYMYACTCISRYVRTYIWLQQPCMILQQNGHLEYSKNSTYIYICVIACIALFIPYVHNIACIALLIVHKLAGICVTMHSCTEGHVSEQRLAAQTFPSVSIDFVPFLPPLPPSLSVCLSF